MCYDAFEVKRCRISARKIRQNVAGFSSWKFGSDFKHIGKHRLRPQILQNQTSKPNTFKALKLMPKARFQLPMSKNYDFTKTKECLRTGIVGCLTPSPHVTRLPNSRIKISTHPHQIRKNDLFLSLGSVIKFNRVR